MSLLSLKIEVLLPIPLFVVVLQPLLVQGTVVIWYPLKEFNETFTKQDYLFSETFAMLHSQDGANLENIFQTLWPLYSNSDYHAAHDDLNEKLFSPMCRRFLAKTNPKQSLADAAGQCTPHAPHIARLGAFCFLLLSRMDSDVVHNRRCVSRGKCKRIFHLLRESVAPLFHRLILWMPWDYKEFRLDILKILDESINLSQDEINSFDVFLRCLSKFYYSYCTNHMKTVLLPLE